MKKAMRVDPAEVRAIIQKALMEDKVRRDITTHGIIDPHIHGQGYFVAKQEGVLAGLDVAREVFRIVDKDVKFKKLLSDGARVKKDAVLAKVVGRAISLLQAERTSLNFLQHLSGVATLASRFVEKVKGTGAVILDTRKTIPGFRLLQKYAVRKGGATNHRMDLAESVLVKNNHFEFVDFEEGVKRAVRKVRGKKPVIVEVTKVSQVLPAIRGGATRLLLDNMTIPHMKQIVSQVKGRVELEASGGIDLHNVRQVAQTGVDFISVGALTHSVRAMDISLVIKGS